MNDFTFEDAIRIQDEHLAEWKTVLIPKVYADLHKWAKASNKKTKRPHDIMRGTYLDNYIANYMKGYRPKPGYTS